MTSVDLRKRPTADRRRSDVASRQPKSPCGGDGGGDGTSVVEWNAPYVVKTRTLSDVIVCSVGGCVDTKNRVLFKFVSFKRDDSFSLLKISIGYTIDSKIHMVCSHIVGGQCLLADDTLLRISNEIETGFNNIHSVSIIVDKTNNFVDVYINDVAVHRHNASNKDLKVYFSGSGSAKVFTSTNF